MKNTNLLTFSPPQTNTFPYPVSNSSILFSKQYFRPLQFPSIFHHHRLHHRHLGGGDAQQQANSTGSSLYQVPAFFPSGQSLGTFLMPLILGSDVYSSCFCDKMTTALCPMLNSRSSRLTTPQTNATLIRFEQWTYPLWPTHCVFNNTELYSLYNNSNYLLIMDHETVLIVNKKAFNFRTCDFMVFNCSLA